MYNTAFVPGSYEASHFPHTGHFNLRFNKIPHFRKKGLRYCDRLGDRATGKEKSSATMSLIALYHKSSFLSILYSKNTGKPYQKNLEKTSTLFPVIDCAYSDNIAIPSGTSSCLFFPTTVYEQSISIIFP